MKREKEKKQVNFSLRKKWVVILTLLVLLVFAKMLFAQENRQEQSSVLIKKALDQGEIDLDAYFLTRVQAIFAPESLPVKFKGELKPKPNRNFTPLLKELQTSLGKLKPETLAKLQSFLLRPTDASYVVWSTHFEYTVSEATPYDTTHFRIHYVSSTADAPAATDGNSNSVPDYVEQMGSVFENVYTAEITNMGYTAPPGDGSKGGNGKFDVYIKNIGSYFLFGWADPEGSSSGNSWYSFMVMDNDYSTAEFPTHTSLENLQVTAAHEFHHAVQFGYNVYTDSWLMEATSTWMEDEVYDAVNDNLQYLAQDSGTKSAWFKRPEASLDLNSGDGWHWYGSWIWNRCLSERYGRNIVRDIWDRCKTGTDSLPAIAQVLAANGITMADAFSDFTARNFTKNRRYIYNAGIGEPYDEGGSYPNIKIENNASPHSSYPLPSQSVLLDHLASRYYKLIPQSGATAKTLKISFNGPNGKDCGAVVVMKTKDGRKIDQRIALDAQKDGTVVVSGFGTSVRNYADVDTAILVVNNSSQTDNGLQFGYSAQYLNGADPQITPWGWNWGYVSPFWQSADIWVDTDGDGNKNEAANSASGQKAEPAVGQLNKLYAFIRNLGDASAATVTVKFYYIPAGIGLPESAFKLIGTKTESLAIGQEKEVQVDWDMTNLSENNGGQWPQGIQNYDHFCVRVVLEYSGDVNANNNLAQSNFGNVPVDTTASPKLTWVKFLLYNRFDFPVQAALVFSPTLSKGWEYKSEEIRDIRNFTLPARGMKTVSLAFIPPANFSAKDGFILNISGIINGEMAGGMSYFLGAPPPPNRYQWGLSLHGGKTFPTGTMATVYNGGVMSGADLEYYFKPLWALVGFVGYNRFSAASPSLTGTSIWNFSLNLKHDLNPNPLRPFVNVGGGLYLPKGGNANAGVNVGIGFDRTVAPPWVVELALDHHHVFCSGDDLVFWVLHVGAIYRF